MPQTAVFTSSYTPITTDVSMTQITVACNSHAEESKTTRLGMSRLDPSLWSVRDRIDKALFL